MDNLMPGPKGPLTSEEIGLQLQRIFLAPYFSKSVILRKILSFITQETLMNRANCLKEYTIAVNVLGKPVDFKPQENGIVRIHAGRLRRALSRYYKQQGLSDQIVIQIPKGKYVPEFIDRLNPGPIKSLVTEFDGTDTKEIVDENITLAILPFLTESTEEHNAFVDGLCMQLSTDLMRIDSISVIAYRAVKNLAQHSDDFHELNDSLKLNYLVSGCVQYTRAKVRINVHLVECDSYREVWSETYERKLTKSNTFSIQDEICKYTCNKIEELTRAKIVKESYLVPIPSAV